MPCRRILHDECQLLCTRPSRKCRRCPCTRRCPSRSCSSNSFLLMRNQTPTTAVEHTASGPQRRTKHPSSCSRALASQRAELSKHTTRHLATKHFGQPRAPQCRAFHPPSGAAWAGVAAHSAHIAAMTAATPPGPLERGPIRRRMLAIAAAVLVEPTSLNGVGQTDKR